MGSHVNFFADDDELPWPSYTRALDYELELGAIGGFVVINDLSARDVQYPEMKSGFGPVKSKNFAPLLKDLRGVDSLRERRPGVFYLGCKEFMHFHELPDSIVADIFFPNERLRLPVTSRPEQLDVLDRIWSSIERAGRR